MLKKEFGNELSDEFIESIGDGRELTDIEKGSIIEQFFITPAVELKYFNKAVERYKKHINSLPEGSEEMLLNVLTGCCGMNGRQLKEAAEVFYSEPKECLWFFLYVL